LEFHSRHTSEPMAASSIRCTIRCAMICGEYISARHAVQAARCTEAVCFRPEGRAVSPAGAASGARGVVG